VHSLQQPRKMSLTGENPVYPTRATRRSGGVSQFLSLDLYSKGNIEKAITCFNPDENHNGIRVDPTTPAKTPTTSSTASTKAKRRTLSAVQAKAGLKRPKRSASSCSDASEAPASTTPQPKRRGRPPGSGKARGGKAAAAGSKQPKKEPKTPAVVKQEVLSDAEEDEVPPTPALSRAAAAAAAAFDPPAARVRSDLSLNDETMMAPGQNHDYDLPALLDQMTVGSNPQMNSTRRREVVSQLDELVCVATTMTSVCYETVIANLKMAEKQIMNGNRLTDPAVLQNKIAAQESEKEKMEKALAAWKEKEKDWRDTEQELNRMLTLGQTTMQQLQQENAQIQQDNAQLQHENGQLLQQLQDLKDQLDQLQQQHQQSAVRDRALVSVSSTSAGPSTSAGVGAFPHSQMMMAHAMPPAFNVQNMPRGSVIGHTNMAGRADELINGLANIAGMGDSMASVAVTAATMPEVDEDGNQVQRTIRTRVERIAVTDDMDIDELQRMGFQVVSVDEGDTDDEHGGNGGMIEEMEGDEHGRGDEEEGEPLIEEMD
ncbi:hypothetical protein PMAYCL1PPCAC_00439, partial [Pristionchus mayeri]